MVKLIEIECPHCRQNCDIYLSSKASLIILNCPGCWKPLMYHNQKCLLLTKNQAKQIEQNHHETAIHDLLNKICNETDAVKEPVRSTKAVSKTPYKMQQAPTPSYSSMPLDRPDISEDDVVNLRIDLEMCLDVQDFIDRL
ncbi:MAG: hypothetical protein GF398_13365 [Chitinivibrionales bacterium]|nr:hypothetical protein [Chitinivibrionales bacterium]